MSCCSTLAKTVFYDFSARELHLFMFVVGVN